ncbi:hypothetical protein KDH_31540 [Dictyobacter sp. S3.2.2.5]|uniref:Uncharacterized protein n=1 Tax=Dictyobacter halimunensis TaxID=3026934 RepID=A0ABQ6FRJ3_9CHLR|nr:hypothetical protein KDH_31540 [Dictyobacter sp. S3.2.2.5]
MDWNNPNHIAIFAGWGQWVSAIVSLAAVIVAIWVSIRASKDSQKQSQRIRYDSALPALVIAGDNPVHTINDSGPNDSAYISYDDRRSHRLQTIHTQLGKKGWIDWNEAKHLLTLQNVGTGVAFNVMSVIFGPEALAHNDKLLDASRNDYWHTKINIINIGESKTCQYSKPVLALLKGSIDSYSFLAPSQPIISPAEKERMLYEDWIICRVTTTYRDIFKRKHASIFDLDIRGHWIMRAFLEDIPNDLYDLQKEEHPNHTHAVDKYFGHLFKKK